MVPDDVTATALVSVDDQVITTAPEISYEDIIEEINDLQQQGDEEESDDEDITIEENIDPVVEKPSRPVTESAIDALKDVTMFSDDGQQMRLSKEILQTFLNKFKRPFIFTFQPIRSKKRAKCFIPWIQCTQPSM